MSTLREALQSRGSVPGFIDVVVARQSLTRPTTLTHCCSSDALSETPPPTLKMPRSGSDRSPRKTTHDALAAKTSKGVLRNMSYQLANGDSFISDNGGLSTPRTGGLVSKSLAGMKAPTIHGGHGDTVLIETAESQPPSVSLSLLSLLINFQAVFGPGNGCPMATNVFSCCCCWGSCCYQFFDSLRLCRYSTDHNETFRIILHNFHIIENILHQATVADFPFSS